jgi:vacuolar-type H+-ATPase subunit D/Vma8
MENTKKITTEQLEKISNQQKELNTLLTNIGLLESQKHGLLHKIAEVNKDVEEFKNTLQQEYGNINIDLTDGSYAEVEETVE